MTLSPPAAIAPATAQEPSTRRAGSAQLRASAGKRACAYLIDFAIVAVITLLVWLLSGSLILAAVALIELWAIGWLWEGHSGATPGNLACGIRTVRRDGLVSVGAPRLFLRNLILGASHVIPIALPISFAASGMLDGIAGARVIDLRAARSAPTSQTGGAALLETRVSGIGSAEVVAAAKPELITRTPISQPASAQAALPPAGPPSATVPAFVLSDGTVIRATGLGFIGRAPRPPESIAEAILIRVPDGARSLSRTHASFGIEDGQLWVQDLGSANGASVRRPDGAVTQVAPQTPYFLDHGDILVLGGDAELAVRRVRGRAEGARTEPPADPAVARVPADAAPPAAERSATPGPVALQFDNGTAIPIHGTGYIGRAPSVPEGEPGDAALVTVPDGDRSVSRTHGRFGVTDAQTWFEDLGSGNGSSLRTGDGRHGPMTPNQRFTLVPGMVIQLGDCVIRVVAG